ncbi:MAG: S8 family serine peptidase [Acidimicrobiia bacterium]
MRKTVLLLTALATAVALAIPVGAAETDAPKSDPPVSRDYVTVSLSSPPTASYSGGIGDLKRTKPMRGKLDTTSPAFAAYQKHLSEERAAFVNEMRNRAPRAEVVRTYSLTLNGMAIKLNGHSLQEISRVSGISNIGFSSLYKPDMSVSVGLIGADEVWGSLGGQRNAGEGITVGIIDTGIDDTHDFFKCKGDPRRTGDGIEHEVFVSGEGTELFGETLVFDHGTHVAGTVAGCVFDGRKAEPVAVSGTLSGVAPGATLHDYNVFPGFGAGFIAFGGSAFSHDIAAALEEAVADGMDVVNMSLGGAVQGPHDFLAEASNATVDAGVVVVTSAGNEGPGDATVGSPGTAEKAITVAAMTNGHFGGVPVDVGDVQYVAAAGDFGPFGDPTGPAPLVWWENATGNDDTLACDAADDGSVIDGNIALIQRGACSFTTKVRNAENAGAVGVIVYNNVGGGPVSMAHDGTDPKPEIVAVMVSRDDGAEIIDTGLGEATTIGGGAVEFLTEPDIIAGFSSRGPAPFSYIIKPDITAPGVNVYSSVFDGQFAFFQGTSMSSPHVAGAAALLLDDDGMRDPIDVKSALVNTANRERFVHDDLGIELLARGGGIAWLPDALDSPATLNPVSISFGLWTGNKPVSGSAQIGISDGSCSNVSVTHTDGTVTTEIVTATLSGDTVTVTLDAGRSDKTPSGDYSGDIVLICGGETLLAPWFVRIDRESKP